MPRPMNRSQMQAKLRQAQANQRQEAQKFNSAVRKYNNEVRAHNSRVNSAINNYNREVRTYNSRVRANRTRLRSTLNRLSHQTVTVRYSVVHSSVLELASAYERLDASNSDPFLSDLAERETANSAQVLTSLLDDSGDPLEATTDLTNTTITDSLVRISPDLNPDGLVRCLRCTQTTPTQLGISARVLEKSSPPFSTLRHPMKNCFTETHTAN